MTYPTEPPSPSSYRTDPTSTPAPPTQAPPTYSDGNTLYESPVPQSGSGNASEASTADVAKEQASEVSDTAAKAGQQVAEVAREQAANVVAETKSEAKNLLGQTRDELTSQAGAQQRRVADGLRSLGSELQSMAGNADTEGPATKVARQAADRVNTAAGWLERHEPGQVLTEIQRFARQRPGAFLAMAAAAGLVAGRLTRGLTADSANGRPSGTALGDPSRMPGNEASGPMEPHHGWPSGASAGPAAYGSEISSPPGFEAPPSPATAWPQDPIPAVGDTGYSEPGMGTVGR